MIQVMPLTVHTLSDLGGRREPPWDPTSTDYGSVGWGFDSSWLHHF